MTTKIKNVKTPLKIVEEVFSSLTHGLGAIFGVVGLIIGLVTLDASTAFTISFWVYSICLVLLMTTSSLYHALKFTGAARVFQILDHGAIFLLIVGTFTPFIVAMYSGWTMAVLLIIAWSLAITGITLKATLPKVMNKFGAGIYIAFGWLAILFVPKMSSLPPNVIWLLIIGGLLYTTGAIFLASKKPFMHVTWHVFVVAAACTHYFAVLGLA